MKKTDKREYVKPRLYHKVIKDIEQTIDKIIKDDRSIDRSFWTDHIKFSDVVLMDPMTTQDPDKNMKELVESSSIYLISMLILIDWTLEDRLEYEYITNNVLPGYIHLPENEDGYTLKELQDFVYDEGDKYGYSIMTWSIDDDPNISWNISKES